MSRGKTMRRIVLPQAMRVIVPPTGNETIAMVKDTSLLIAHPLNTELFFQLRSIGTRTLQIFPVAVAATLWYLIVSQRVHGRSVLPRDDTSDGASARPRPVRRPSRQARRQRLGFDGGAR